MTPALDASPPGPEASLEALRGEIDAIDDALHDLVMRRAAVVARLSASRVKGDASSLRPGREASILRRLLSRHAGPLPPAALVRLWREILSASNAMQGAFSVALPAGDADVYRAARSRFGTMGEPRFEDGPDAALAVLADGGAQAAVLPTPSEDGAGAWWTALDAPRLQVVARLPFYAVSPVPQGMVVTRDGPDPSGDDRSLLRLDFDHDAIMPQSDEGFPPGVPADATDPWPEATRRPLAGALRAAGLPARALLLNRQHACAYALAEVDGAVAADDPRLSALRARLPLNRVQPLGFYATPIRPPDGGE
jgi:chorismate mutase/prephenate dehydratase